MRKWYRDYSFVKVLRDAEIQAKHKPELPGWYMIKDSIINQAPTEKEKEEWAEAYLKLMFDYEKGVDYKRAFLSEDGKVCFDPMQPINYIEFSLGVVRKDESILGSNQTITE
jgi:hypothetical protein